jgi:hypothetical protein
MCNGVNTGGGRKKRVVKAGFLQKANSEVLKMTRRGRVSQLQNWSGARTKRGSRACFHSMQSLPSTGR